jgi:hypothetical protein
VRKTASFNILTECLSGILLRADVDYSATKKAASTVNVLKDGPKIKNQAGMKDTSLYSLLPNS